MYRHLLGDCFLLRLPGTAGADVWILIDCGVLQGFGNAREVMRGIAQDIRATTKGRIDVLIATHEHWDHLSGFWQAEDIFAGIEIGELWLAWTEDEQDELATKLRQAKQRALGVLQQLKARFTAAPTAAQGIDEAPDDADGEDTLPRSQAFIGLLDFYDDMPGLQAAGRRTTGEIIADLKRRTGPGKVRYWRPGADPFPIPGVADARVFVLGPPRDEILLRRSDPSSRASEVYLLPSDRDELCAALAGAVPEDEALFEPTSSARLNLPFEPRQMIRADRLEGADPDSAEASQRALARLHRRYHDGLAWRRIDDDWLGAAEQLALKLDSDTNNTSLALALELAPGGKVLLFPGDAQVGNWLSWAALSWPGGSADAAPVTARDLLGRTVLYKVGHHASHNATLREQGLELMGNDLVAMIPVNEEFARTSKGWDMPYPALHARLLEKTRGRVLRADRGKADLAARPESAPDTEQWSAFLATVRTDPGDTLFIEHEIRF